MSSKLYSLQVCCEFHLFAIAVIITYTHMTALLEYHG